MNQSEIENDYARFFLKDDILYFVYKDKITMDLAAAKRIVADRLELQNNVSYPVMCFINSMESSEKSARDYLAKEGSALTSTVALIVKSPALKIITTFYLLVNKPTVPTKVFLNEADALIYLKEFVSEPK